MWFKIDESLHADVAALLIDAGHEAHTVHDEGLQGTDDASLALHCVNEVRRSRNAGPRFCRHSGISAGG